MYIENWESFYQQAVDLYQNDPLKTRFVTKYRHCDGKLTLKVTDDTTVGCMRRGQGGRRGRVALSVAAPLAAVVAIGACRGSQQAPLLPGTTPAVLAIQDRPAGGPEENREAEPSVLCADGHRGAAAARCALARPPPLWEHGPLAAAKQTAYTSHV